VKGRGSLGAQGRRPARSCPLGCATTARRVWREDGLRYLRCTGCGVVFSDISAAQYAAARHNVWDDDELASTTLEFYRDARLVPHSEYLSELARRRSGGTLLDIGCGLGVFLERAEAAGWDVHGCDTSPFWVEQARERTSAARVTCGEPSSELFSGRRFDVVTMWDVIEHIYDPLATLRIARDLLAPGGELFIRTPNFRYVWPLYGARRVLRSQVELGPLNHVVYFDARSMRRALALAGLRSCSWRVFPPPQVRVGGSTLSVGAKNAFAGMASCLAGASRGRLVIGSDLDVRSAAV